MTCKQRPRRPWKKWLRQRRLESQTHSSFTVIVQVDTTLVAALVQRSATSADDTQQRCEDVGLKFSELKHAADGVGELVSEQLGTWESTRVENMEKLSAQLLAQLEQSRAVISAGELTLARDAELSELQELETALDALLQPESLPAKVGAALGTVLLWLMSVPCRCTSPLTWAWHLTSAHSYSRSRARRDSMLPLP